jgi:hypothetical protein
MIYLEWFIAIAALTVFAFAFAGAILHANDRQKFYDEQRRREVSNVNKRRAD